MILLKFFFSFKRKKHKKEAWKYPVAFQNVVCHHLLPPLFGLLLGVPKSHLLKDATKVGGVKRCEREIHRVTDQGGLQFHIRLCPCPSPEKNQIDFSSMQAD